MDHQQIIPSEQRAAATEAAINGDIARLQVFLHNYQNYPEVMQWYGEAGIKPENEESDNARLLICYTNYFNSWPEFGKFKKEISREDSLVRQFEQAADAIVTGDVDMLKTMLQQNPGLVYLRSARNHRATLLNYVGANGFEGYRQRTPSNAVEVAEILLKAGAEVDGAGDMYRGTTTLGLVATSVHPVIAGVQEPLMDILIRHGADPNHAVAPDYTEGSLILACLANGRGEPVAYLAKQGVPLDLESAAGVGDLEKVKSYFNADGSLVQDSLTAKRDAGFIWACEYGRIHVVEYMLAQGISSATEARGMSALHWAVVGGQVDVVKLLLSKKAPLEVLNSYGGTVLGQALWSAYSEPKPRHPDIIETLIAAGATIPEKWRGL